MFYIEIINIIYHCRSLEPTWSHWFLAASTAPTTGGKWPRHGWFHLVQSGARLSRQTTPGRVEGVLMSHVGALKMAALMVKWWSLMIIKAFFMEDVFKSWDTNFQPQSCKSGKRPSSYKWFANADRNTGTVSEAVIHQPFMGLVPSWPPQKRCVPETCTFIPNTVVSTSIVFSSKQRGLLKTQRSLDWSLRENLQETMVIAWFCHQI